ncbi:MAG: hypothetical protein ACI9CA_001212, partial [Natronomonas sp.]
RDTQYQRAISYFRNKTDTAPSDDPVESVVT